LPFYISAYTTLNELLAAFLYIIFAVLLKFPYYEVQLLFQLADSRSSRHIGLCVLERRDVGSVETHEIVLHPKH